MKPRLLAALLVLIPAALLGFGYYLQRVEGLEPCPLCILQRIAFAAVAAGGLVGLVLARWPMTVRLAAGFSTLAGLAGLTVALRQVWLQHFPPEGMAECGPDLAFLLEMEGVSAAVAEAFRGSGDCAEVVWRWLGLTIPEWSALAFVGLIVVALCILLRPR